MRSASSALRSATIGNHRAPWRAPATLPVCLPDLRRAGEPRARWSTRWRRCAPARRRPGDVLVIDDSSPDGTGEIADQLAADAAVAARAAPARARRGSAAPTSRASAGRSSATTTYVARDGLRLLPRPGRDPGAAAHAPRTAPTSCSARATCAGGGVARLGPRAAAHLARRLPLRAAAPRLRRARPDRRLQVLPPRACSRRSTLDEVGAEGYAFQIEMTYRALAARLPRRRGADRRSRDRVARRLEDVAARSCARRRGASRSCGWRALRGRIPRSSR